MPMIVAIDGPAGAGKSTIAEETARALGITRVNTGAIYRALTLVTLREGIDDDDRIAGALGVLDELRFEGQRVFLGDEDISEAIRTVEVTAAVSRVSAIPEVRAGLLGMQRRLAHSSAGGVVMEGRDIGTVVFPEADVKIFLTASPEERARRRLKDLEAAGASADYDRVLADMKRRDTYDARREVAPLRPADDAIEVDSTGKTVEEVVAEIVGIVEARRG
jgi:cytidylate kinase